MNVITDLLKLTLAALFVVFIIPLLLVAITYVGYFFGLIVMTLAGGVLTGVLPISTGAIPYIFAWLFVLAGIISLGRGRNNNE